MPDHEQRKMRTKTMPDHEQAAREYHAVSTTELDRLRAEVERLTAENAELRSRLERPQYVGARG